MGLIFQLKDPTPDIIMSIITEMVIIVYYCKLLVITRKDLWMCFVAKQVRYMMPDY